MNMFDPPDADIALRDIRLPPSPSWWPPAPGWWVLLGSICVVLVVGFLIFRRRRRQRLWQKKVLEEIQTLAARHVNDDAAYAASLHQLLRRAARRYAADAHQLQGEPWRAVLAQVPVDNVTLDKLMTIDVRMYQAHADFDREGVQAAVRRWLDIALQRKGATSQGAGHA